MTSCNVIPCCCVFCDNGHYIILEYDPKDNGVIFLVTKNSKNSKNIISLPLGVLLLTSDISPLRILLAMTRIKKEL